MSARLSKLGDPEKPHAHTHTTTPLSSEHTLSEPVKTPRRHRRVIGSRFVRTRSLHDSILNLPKTTKYNPAEYDLKKKSKKKKRTIQHRTKVEETDESGDQPIAESKSRSRCRSVEVGLVDEFYYFCCFLVFFFFFPKDHEGFPCQRHARPCRGQRATPSVRKTRKTTAGPGRQSPPSVIGFSSIVRPPALRAPWWTVGRARGPLKSRRPPSRRDERAFEVTAGSRRRGLGELSALTASHSAEARAPSNRIAAREGSSGTVLSLYHD